MSQTDLVEAPLRPPLEDFIRDYVETVGGVWDEVEPQVYDVLLPLDGTTASLGADAGGVLRVAFDPEALPEHPGAQLASFGTPFIDQLLGDAMRRGRFAQLYVVGLNLLPHDLAGRVRRALTLASGLQLRVERTRPLHFTQAVYFFQAAFVSDQKEQEIVPVGLDLHYGREMRHLDHLLDRGRLADRPAQPLAEAKRISVAAGYPIAREHVVRTLAALANSRARELDERLGRQIERMSQYYADMRQEAQEQAHRSRKQEEDSCKLAARLQALDREEKLRVTELRQKNNLRLQLRLINLQVVQQPKVLLQTQVASEKLAAPLELVWDPLMETLEAPPCPNCGRPGFAFELSRQGRLVCPVCVTSAAPARRHHQS